MPGDPANRLHTTEHYTITDDEPTTDLRSDHMTDHTDPVDIYRKTYQQIWQTFARKHGATDANLAIHRKWKRIAAEVKIAKVTMP
jgi:hypothetical protein